MAAVRPAIPAPAMAMRSFGVSDDEGLEEDIVKVSVKEEEICDRDNEFHLMRLIGSIFYQSRHLCI